MRISGETSWGERLGRAVLQAGNQPACPETQKKVTGSGAQETRGRRKGDEFREVKGLTRTL